MQRLAPTLLTAFAFAAICAIACGRSEVYRQPADDDVFGLDGGRRTDGGVDAGRDPWFECDVEKQDCGAGTGACFYYRLNDGGIGSHCKTGECSLIAQDCPNGEKCGFGRPSDGGVPQRVCVPNGSVEEGKPCTGDSLDNDCKRGLECGQRAFLDGGHEQVCRRFCFSSTTCTSPQICYALIVVPDIPEIPLTCENPPGGCSLLNQNCGRAGQACYPGQSTPLCFNEGTVPVGGPCIFSNDCTKGAACFSDRCRVMCSTSGTPGCEPGLSCRPVTVPGVADGVGACL